MNQKKDNQTCYRCSLKLQAKSKTNARVGTNFSTSGQNSVSYYDQIMANIVKLINIKRALNAKPGKGILYSVSGRIKKFRTYKSFNFVELEDGSTRDHLQLVVNKHLLKKPEIGSYITCHGNLMTSIGPKQPLEFRVAKIDFSSKCDHKEYPLAHLASDSSDDWFRTFLHLRPRAPHFTSLLRIRSELELAIHMIMKQMDFFLIHTPKLSANDSEASSDLFVVKRSHLPKSADLQEDQKHHNNGPRVIRDDYFESDVFLTTSSQLHLENAAASLSRVYTIGPAFRAENSITTRHLCEFLMFEAEEANVTDIETLMSRVESLIKFISQYLKEVSEYKDDFESLICRNENRDVYDKLTHESYIKMTYSEALETLKNKTDFSGNVQDGCDIGRQHEKKLLEYCNNIPVFITEYPKQLKPFYMKCDQDNRLAKCFDLIMPIGGEVCGGSLREDNCDKLLENLTRPSGNSIAGSHNLKENSKNSVGDVNHKNHNYFDWYLDSRRFGSFPHGGFGIGIERLLQTLLGIRNIKDTTAFPRWSGHCPM